MCVHIYWKFAVPVAAHLGPKHKVQIQIQHKMLLRICGIRCGIRTAPDLLPKRCGECFAPIRARVKRRSVHDVLHFKHVLSFGFQEAFSKSVWHFRIFFAFLHFSLPMQCQPPHGLGDCFPEIQDCELKMVRSIVHIPANIQKHATQNLA